MAFRYFSLGLEELALGFSMINKPVVAQDLLKAFYDDLDRVKIESRLSSASHSLLARGICGFAEDGSPRLDADLEQTLLPLVKFDYAFQFNIVRDNISNSATIHVLKKRGFTSHTVQAGVIHILENGPVDELGAFFLKVLADFSEKDSKKTILETKITLGQLGAALKITDIDKITSMVTSAGVEKATSQLLAADLIDPVFRATLIRINAGNDVKEEDIGKKTAPTLLFLLGQDRSWMFKFPGSTDDSVGSMTIVDREQFKQILKEFIK